MRWQIPNSAVGPEKEDKYTIIGVMKMSGDAWVINARIQYNKKDVIAPIPVQVKWAGDTPVIIVDKLPFPRAFWFTTIPTLGHGLAAIMADCSMALSRTKRNETLSTVAPSEPLCSHPIRSILRSAWGLAVAGLCGAALWAVADQPRYAHLSKAAVDAASTVTFLIISGLLLRSQLEGSRSLLRLYKIFIPAFFTYATIWWAFCYLLVFPGSDWFGALLGCAAFALVLAKAFGNYRALPTVIAILFITHSAGYFAGGFAMQYVMTPGNAAWLGLSKRGIGIVARLMWGVCFGAGFGLGIGYAFFAMQKKPSL